MPIRFVEQPMGSGMTVSDTGFTYVETYSRAKPGGIYKTVQVMGYWRKGKKDVK